MNYELFKSTAIDNEPLHLTVPVSSIKIESDSIDKKYIVIRYGTEQKFSVSKKFFNELISILDIKMSMKKNLSNNQKLFAVLINALKDASNAISPYNVTILYDKTAKRITSVTKGDVKKLSNKTLFAFIEMVLNENSDLELYAVSGASDGNPEIKLLAGKITDLTPNIDNNVEDESFNFGLSIYNHGLITGIGDFAYRLVCSNGMMGIATDERLNLTGNNEKNIQELYSEYHSMQENSFIPENIQENVEQAYQIHASLFEVEHAYNMVINNIVSNTLEKEMVDEYIKSHWFPEIDITYQRIKAKNIDPIMLDNKEKKHIKTRMSMWELINNITYIASHKDQVFAVIAANRLQKYAGQMLNKDWNFKFESYLYI